MATVTAMHNDSNRSPRFNPYRDAHKGLRLLLSELMERAGRTDFSAATELARLRAEAHVAFQLLTSHARHEDAFFGPLLEAHCPRVAREIDLDHEDQQLKLRELACVLTSIDALGGDAALRGHDFCVRLARVAGELLVHMSQEEQLALPALWQKLSDDSLRGISAGLLASIPAPERRLWLKCMLRALNQPERRSLLGRMRAAMPRAAFDATLESFRAELEDLYEGLVSDLRMLDQAAA
ncbi:MAG TPA: hemerythrin domain-containing protein [Polyangiales bacterium]